jgi:hypothetical protein
MKNYPKVCLPLILLLIFCTQPESPETIQAFCVDFNWGEGGINRFARPGLWADADPKEHVAWYDSLGVNTIQTFAVSCNGYAWYKNGDIPPQPDLKHDFLPEMVRLGHEKGMQVMGYFCIGANTRWALENPDYSYGTPNRPHIPFTDFYLSYLRSAIQEALKISKMDGFMVDWIWNPSNEIRGDLWLETEKELFETLMEKPFPDKSLLSPEEKLEYERKAIDRCWQTIRNAAKSIDPDCIIWLTCNDLEHPTVVNSNMFREVDWLMNENVDPTTIKTVQNMIGEQTRLIQCLVGWGDRHNAYKVLSDQAFQDLNWYGFSKPDEDSLPLPVKTYLSDPYDSFKGNNKNIAVLARFYNNWPLDGVVY